MSGQQRARQERGARIEQGGVRGFEQVGLRVHPGELRGLDEGVEERRDLGPAPGAATVKWFFRSIDHPTQNTLGGIVQRDAGVVEEARQAGPEPQHVRNGLTDTALG